MRIPFIGPSYHSRSLNIDTSRSINFFLEMGQEGNQTIPKALIGTPGTVKFTTVGSGPIRGMYSGIGIVVVVSGDEVYVLSSDGTSTLLGTLTTSTGPISMKDNGMLSSGVGGNQILLVDGEYGYIVDGSSITQITDADFVNGATSVAFIDGYFVVNRPNSMSFGVCDLYNGTAWNGLATASVSAYPDLLKMCANYNQQLWLIKEYSSEVWYNAAVPTSQGSPFLRISGGVIAYGIAADASFAIGDNGLFFLANQRTENGGTMVGIVQVMGYVPTIISPPAITYQISRMERWDDAIGYVYNHEGHTFYVITFPSGNKTYVYDASLGTVEPYQRWHERSKWVEGSGEYGRHHGNCYCYAFGKHLIGDYNSGNVYEMRSDVYDDDGDPIIGVRQCPALSDKDRNKNVFIHNMTLEIESGVGNEDVQNPQIGLSWSKDSGNTWGNEYVKSMGRVGEYGKRVTWTRIGSGRNKIMRVRISDAVKRVIVGATIE